MGTTEVTMTVINMYWYHWIYYCLAAILGAVASSLVLNKGNLIWPHWEKVPETEGTLEVIENKDENESMKSAGEEKKKAKPVSKNKKKSEKLEPALFEKARDMGFTGDMIVGLAAAFAVWWAMTPQTLFQLIGIGAIAGYGGSTILQSLVNKVKADISMTEKEKLELEKEKMVLEKLKMEVETQRNELEKRKQDISEDEKNVGLLDLEVFLTKTLGKYKEDKGGTA